MYCNLSICVRFLFRNYSCSYKMTKRNDIHWYCGSCKPKVMQCIKLEREIERKLADLMEKLNIRQRPWKEVFTRR